MSDLSPFHQELFSFLKKNAKERTEEESFDLENDPQLQKMHRLLEVPQGASLNEIIEDYQHLFEHRGPTHIEYRWMRSFQEREFADVGLSRYFPRIYRGLPRVYHRDDPSRSHIKKNFTNLADLRRLSVDRAVLSLYEGTAKVGSIKVGILTHVLPDGLGDWTAAVETASILAAKWPSLDIHLFIATSRKLPQENGAFHVHTFFLNEVSGPVPSAIQEMDVLLQIPTRFPVAPGEKIGEYGFLESDWFHPKSGNRSMGLHVLEKGIFTPKMGRSSFAEIERKELLITLFNTETPGPIEIETYRAKNRFHLAYLASSIGGVIYLHSLLKMCERDERNIDLCCPDLKWLIKWLEEQRQIEAKAFGIKEILILFQEHSYSLPVAEKGKTVRIIHCGPLSRADMWRLISLSDDWIAIRGNHSFSEAISAKKAFFYDGLQHARYFVKDITALAENRLSGHRSALHAFRLMNQAFLWNLPEDTSEWVDESHFQREERPPWMEIALELGALLQDPDAIVGFKKFCTIVSEEHSFNSFVCHLLEKEFFRLEHPSLFEEQQQLLELYASAQISFPTLVKNLKAHIYPS